MQHFTYAAYQKTTASEVHLNVYKITVCFKTPNISMDSFQVPQMHAKISVFDEVPRMPLWVNIFGYHYKCLHVCICAWEFGRGYTYPHAHA